MSVNREFENPRISEQGERRREIAVAHVDLHLDHFYRTLCQCPLKSATYHELWKYILRGIVPRQGLDRQRIGIPTRA